MTCTGFYGGMTATDRDELKVPLKMSLSGRGRVVLYHLQGLYIVYGNATIYSVSASISRVQYM